jgi:hypothetical protein
MKIASKEVQIFPSQAENAPLVIVNCFEDEGEAIYRQVQDLTDKDFSFAAIRGIDCYTELTPWKSPALRKKEPDFSDGANAYLSELTEKILPEIQKQIPVPCFSVLAGYSLCGLFAVYAAFTSNAFKRIVCGSGSLWYPGFLEFCKAYEPSEKIDRISFSLGDKEALSKNPVYAAVKTNTLEIQNLFQECGITATFTEFPGNHFFEADKRLAKGITSVL